MKQGVRVFCLDNAHSTRAWEKHEGVEALDLRQATDLLDTVGQGSPVIIDAGMADQTSWGSAICGAVEAGAYLSVPPGNFDVNSLLEEEGLFATNRVFFYTPLLYRPAGLELLRVIADKSIGEPAGVDAVFPGCSADECFDVLVFMYTLVGGAVGRRIAKAGTDKDEVSGILWGDGIAATFSCSSMRQPGHAAVSVACKLGSVTCTFGDCDDVFIVPAGREGYHLPLPEGNGLYYFQMDMIQGVKSNRGPAVLPSEFGGRAMKWIRGIWNEGT